MVDIAGTTVRGFGDVSWSRDLVHSIVSLLIALSLKTFPFVIRILEAVYARFLSNRLRETVPLLHYPYRE